MFFCASSVFSVARLFANIMLSTTPQDINICFIETKNHRYTERVMTGIQNLPAELLFQVMELYSSDLLSLIKAYPTALNTFLDNRKCFIARISAYYGDLSLPSLVRAAMLRYIRRRPAVQALRFKDFEASISSVCAQTTETSFRERNVVLPDLNRYSLAALCIMWELGEEAKGITDMYSQQALAEMAKNHDAEFYIPRQSTELTQNERRRFMTSAFVFESYCLTFFRGQRLLFSRNEHFRESFLDWNETAIGRFYCIMFYVVQKHRELLSSVTKHLEPIYGRAKTYPGRSNKGRYLLWLMKKDYEGRVFNYIHFLASHGLNLLTVLQKMSIRHLTRFTVPVFLHIEQVLRPRVMITLGVRNHPLGTQETHGWLPWAHLDSVLDDRWANRDPEEIWEDTWHRAIPFWDPSEDEPPYGGRKDEVDWLPVYWFLERVL